jgi:hypothetical protein
MRLLDLPQAKHFCAPTPPVIAGITPQSLSAYHGAMSKGVVLLQEGTVRFQVHQVSLLQSVERWLTFSVGHYRRSVEMLVPISAPWAHVTLYYASFFAANAILGLLGGWTGQTSAGLRVVDVENGAVGSQQLRIWRNPIAPSGARGSHRVFWDFFYSATASISAWAPASLAGALSPVNGDIAWQIMERNDVNYDMHHAWAASSRLHTTLKAGRLKTLAGPLKLQLEVTERMIKLALHFAHAVLQSPLSLSGCGAVGSRQQIHRRLATQVPPNLVSQSAFYSLV